MPYSSSQRRRATALVAVASLAAALVKFVVRPQAYAVQHPLAPMLGPAPDFLTGVGLPFVWIVFQTRLTWPIRTPPFASNCFWSCVILTNNEVWQTRDPSRSFDVLDLVMAFAGAGTAYLIHRYWVQAA